ncbi:MAG: hypothetical protein DWQ31_17030 [Planctomycetota bacterium]|nr:MAG: hypothetical protein DWQ31_17030 [Planctomycetota bacterium]REJ92059.1 MAG: hypothetical protein DWQ35_12980 [Planctomycetota bacterium]REK28595.1 MAG: hypothetical protein DWQ42_04570 [Planctomycetota bacterium]REK39210.1 MAG: hypothetical protein DWQ46_18155 [Planctomycetota bacterium]
MLRNRVVTFVSGWVLLDGRLTFSMTCLFLFDDGVKAIPQFFDARDRQARHTHRGISLDHANAGAGTHTDVIPKSLCLKSDKLLGTDDDSFRLLFVRTIAAGIGVDLAGTHGARFRSTLVGWIGAARHSISPVSEGIVDSQNSRPSRILRILMSNRISPVRRISLPSFKTM